MSVMYRCEDCGAIFTEEEMKEFKEAHGEYHYGCPKCGSSDLEQVYRCWECEEYKPVSECHGDICDECVMKHFEDIPDYIEHGAECLPPRTVEINAILAEMFTDNEIENILVNVLKNRRDHEKTIAELNEIVEYNMSAFAYNF